MFGNTVESLKRQVPNWTAQITHLAKDLYPENIHKIQSSVQQHFKGQIYEKTLNQDKQLASNHMKKCHYPPGICIFKPQGYYYTPIRTSKNFKTDLPIIDWGVEQLHAYLQCPQEFRKVSSFWKTVWRVLQKLNTHQLYSSAITLWVVTQEKEMHTSSQRLVHACS